VELVPAVGASAPAIGASVEALAGAAKAPAGAIEAPPALKEEKARILQLEVSRISPRVPLTARGGRLLFCFLVDRVMSTVPALTPAKAIRSGTPVTTRRRSERAPWTVASAAATGEPSRVTAVVARPQQEEETTATSQAPVPRAPPQGRGQARSESRPIRDHGATGATADDDTPPRVGPINGMTRVSPRARTRGAGDARGQLCDVAAPDA
jgi:hypothetical protein